MTDNGLSSLGCTLVPDSVASGRAQGWRVCARLRPGMASPCFSHLRGDGACAVLAIIPEPKRPRRRRRPRSRPEAARRYRQPLPCQSVGMAAQVALSVQ
jgi:hypothetical protein